MNSAGVQQLTVLAELFTLALNYCCPESVAILGVAGGNGLDGIDRTVAKRIVGVDINPRYLDEVRRRFGNFAGLELHCLDLATQNFSVAPVALVHAALIFEHVGLDPALQNAISLVAPRGSLSVVLQLPSDEERCISATNYKSMQELRHHFALIDVGKFQRLLLKMGFQLVVQVSRSLPAGKTFWLGAFSRSPM